MYLAPEVQKQKYDFKVDIFSFGVIIYRCLTLKDIMLYYELLMDKEKTINNLKKDFEEKKTSKELTDLFFEMIEVDPEKRPNSKEVLQKLAKIQNLLKNQVKKPSQTDEEVKKWSNKQVIEWLKTKLNIEDNKILDMFLELEINGEDLLNLSNNDLKDELLIKNLGMRKKIFESIQNLKNQKTENKEVEEIKISLEDHLKTKNIYKITNFENLSDEILENIGKNYKLFKSFTNEIQQLLSKKIVKNEINFYYDYDSFVKNNNINQLFGNSSFFLTSLFESIEYTFKSLNQDVMDVAEINQFLYLQIQNIVFTSNVDINRNEVLLKGVSDGEYFYLDLGVFFNQVPFRIAAFSFLQQFFMSVNFEKLLFVEDFSYGLSSRALFKFKDYYVWKKLTGDYISAMEKVKSDMTEYKLDFIIFETDFESILTDKDSERCVSNYLNHNSFLMISKALKTLHDEYDYVLKKKVKKIIIHHDKDSNKPLFVLNENGVIDITYYLNIHYCVLSQYNFYENFVNVLMK
jgi:serine/threonine protein kinase